MQASFASRDSCSLQWGCLHQLLPLLSNCRALCFKSREGSFIWSFYTPVLILMHGEMIIFLQVCLLYFFKYIFICCIFKYLSLKSEKSVRVLPPSPNSSARHWGKAEPETQQGGTSANFFFGSSVGAGGNTESSFISVWCLGSYSVFCHCLCIFLLLFQCIFLKESHEN